jgi:hypothetical protein
MKFSVLVCLILLPASIALATAPDSLVGYIYYETGVYSGPLPRRGGEYFAATFAGDGTYKQLFFQSTPGAGAPRQLREPKDGTFAYRKIDAFTAELSLSGGSRGILRFDSPTAETGELVDPLRDPNNLMGIVQRRFRLAPLATTTGLANCATRTLVRAGSTASAGFVIVGSSWRYVLVRAIGPSLAAFRVSDPLRDPVVQVQGADRNDDWHAENATSMNRVAAAVGAFPLPALSKDAAILAECPPGPRIVEVSSSDPADSGEVLLEIYLLP